MKNKEIAIATLETVLRNSTDLTMLDRTFIEKAVELLKKED